MIILEISKLIQVLGQNGVGGGYKDVIVIVFNEEVELKGGNGFEVVKVYVVGL